MKALTKSGRLQPAVTRTLAVLISALYVAVDNPPASPVPLAAIGLATSASVWFYDRQPLAVTAIGLTSLLFGGNPIPAVVGIFTLAKRSTVWPAVVFVPLVTTGFVFWAARLEGVFLWMNFFNYGIGVVLITLVGAYVGLRQRLTQSLIEQIDQKKEEAQLRKTNIRYQEQRRIAREIHDVLGHNIAVISLHAGALEVHESLSRDQITATATNIRLAAGNTLNELKSTLDLFRNEPYLEEADGYFADVVQLVQRSRQAGMSITVDGDIPNLPNPLQRTLYRVAQEGITNANKHSPGSPIAIQILQNEPEETRIMIRNKLPAAQPAETSRSHTPGSGLVGLKERLEILNGALTHGCETPDIWLLEATLPLKYRLDEKRNAFD